MNILAVTPTHREKGSIPPYLLNALEGWLNQDLQGSFVDLVIFDNVSHQSFSRNMRNFCVNRSTDNLKLHYITNKEHYPVFNSINLAFTLFNDTKYYDYYIFAQDDDMMTSPHDLLTIISEFNRNPRAGIVAGMMNSDNADMLYPYLMEVGDGSPVKVQLLDALNLHFFVFSRYWMEKYDFKYPDILRAYASETLLTFMCEAIDTEKILCRAVLLKNMNYLKRYSKSMRLKLGLKKKCVGEVGWGTFRNFRSLADIFVEGSKVGLGFDCWRRFNDHRSKKRPNPYWYLPDPKCYNRDGSCKNRAALYQYIKENLFLPKNIMDYTEQLRRIGVY